MSVNIKNACEYWGDDRLINVFRAEAAAHRIEKRGSKEITISK